MALSASPRHMTRRKSCTTVSYTADAGSTLFRSHAPRRRARLCAHRRYWRTMPNRQTHEASYRTYLAARELETGSWQRNDQRAPSFRCCATSRQPSDLLRVFLAEFASTAESNHGKCPPRRRRVSRRINWWSSATRSEWRRRTFLPRLRAAYLTDSAIFLPKWRYPLYAGPQLGKIVSAAAPLGRETPQFIPSRHNTPASMRKFQCVYSAVGPISARITRRSLGRYLVAQHRNPARAWSTFPDHVLSLLARYVPILLRGALRRR